MAKLLYIPTGEFVTFLRQEALTKEVTILIEESRFASMDINKVIKLICKESTTLSFYSIKHRNNIADGAEPSHFEIIKNEKT